jgi:hypothetical protein
LCVRVQVIPEGTGSVKGRFWFPSLTAGRDGTPAGSSWSARSRWWRRGRTSLTTSGGTARWLSPRRRKLRWVLCWLGGSLGQLQWLRQVVRRRPGLGCQSSLRLWAWS